MVQLWYIMVPSPLKSAQRPSGIAFLQHNVLVGFQLSTVRSPMEDLHEAFLLGLAPSERPRMPHPALSR